MYKSFEVRDFRCFPKLTLTDLERVNLIAGVNNVGKTALLEALFLHCGAYNPELILRFNAFRGIETVRVELGRWFITPWDSVFRVFDTSKTVELDGETEETGRRILRLRVVREPEELADTGLADTGVAGTGQGNTGQFIEHGPGKPEKDLRSTEAAHVLELEYQEGKRHGKHYMIIDRKGVRVNPIAPSPPFPAFFQGDRMRIHFPDEAERFGKLEIQGKQDVLLRILQLVEPRLRRLAMVVVGGQPMLHGDIGLPRLIPLPVMGGGMIRLASLVLHIGNAPNGVVLVDEIDNGLHHSALSKVWRAIGEVAREFNAQVFATTHSLECIVAAHRAFTESNVYDFRLHRLERVKEAIRAVTYAQKTLAAAIQTDLEVR